ncbi:MAG: hypothetical protein MK110_09430, partial [Fuerstiella sp.]|nr:hypothetical protein [Fuerstiella sp.]MCH2211512.1 hypothetical protein [Fuerstiella sp.]
DSASGADPNPPNPDPPNRKVITMQWLRMVAGYIAIYWFSYWINILWRQGGSWMPNLFHFFFLGFLFPLFFIVWTRSFLRRQHNLGRRYTWILLLASIIISVGLGFYTVLSCFYIFGSV